MQGKKRSLNADYKSKSFKMSVKDALLKGQKLGLQNRTKVCIDLSAMFKEFEHRLSSSETDVRCRSLK